MSKHYLIFIHGIGELENNDTASLGYDLLWKRLSQQSGLTSEDFNQKFGRIDVIWHVKTLEEAGKAIFESAFPDLKPGILNPMYRLRNFMTFFAGDVAAYVSEDVNFIRRTVWEQIWKYKDELLQEGATYSIIAHSLGSVIAFDYLDYLFHPHTPRLFVPSPNPEKRPEDHHLMGQNNDWSSIDLQVLQDKFRHFFSLGSPVGLFLMRKGELWAEGEPFSQVYNPIRDKGRVWCNFWDSDDPIAYPVARLFGKNPENNHCKLLDIAVDTGWVLKAHVDYWKNHTVAKTIAEWIVEDN